MPDLKMLFVENTETILKRKEKNSQCTKLKEILRKKCTIGYEWNNEYYQDFDCTNYLLKFFNKCGTHLK